MSDPFDSYAAGVFAPTAGPPTSWGDSFDAVFDSASKVDSLLGIDSEIQSRWETTVRNYDKRLGRDSGAPVDMSSVTEYAQPIIDPNHERTWAEGFLGVGEAGEFPERKKAAMDNLRAINEELTKLNDPDLPSVEKIIQDALEARQGLRDREEQVAETGAFGSSIARLAGGIAGSLTLNDPVNLGALFVPGGWGKGIALKLASETGINAVVGAATQEYAINPTRSALGEAEGSVAEAALVGGLGALILRGGAEGVSALASRAIGKRTPQAGIELDFEDAQLRQMFEARPADPNARAGLSLLDVQEHFDAANPYAPTEAGMKKFTGEINDVLAVMSGKSETAGVTIARMTSDVTDFSLENLDFHTQVVREQQPLVFARLEEANVRLNELDARIAEQTQTLDGITVADGVRRIDEDTANLVTDYEATARDTSQPMQVREEAARKLNVIVESLGEKQVIKEIDNAGITPKKELQSLRASRKAAAKEFRVARKEMDQAISQVQAAERLAAITTQPDVGAHPQRYDVVESTILSIDAAGEANVARVDAMDEQFRPKADSEEVAHAPGDIIETSGGFDLGNGVLIPKDFKFLVDGKEVSAAAVWKDLKDDYALIEAMRICSL